MLNLISHIKLGRMLALSALLAVLIVTSTRLRADTASCNGASVTLPFIDVPGSNIFFCSIAEAYFSGLTNGTSPATYNPADPVTREQMAAFVTRTLDQSLRRGSRRAALNQWWTPGSIPALDLTATTTDDGPSGVACDGTDIWVTTVPQPSGCTTVTRVRASDGKILQTLSQCGDFWSPPLIALGKVFVSNRCNELHMIDPKSGVVTLATANLGGDEIRNLAFDGAKIWAASSGGVFGCDGAPLSFTTVGSTTPWSTTTVTAGFSQLFGILYDGSHIWVTDRGDNRLKKVNKVNGAVLQSIPVGTDPGNPVFDGMNIWVPNTGSDNITVVRVKDAAGNPLSSAFVLKTLTAPFMLAPFTAAFDGERVLVACQSQGIFLFKAADLSRITGISTAPNSVPYGACSDGVNFFVTLNGANKLVRF